MNNPEQSWTIPNNPEQSWTILDNPWKSCSIKKSSIKKKYLVYIYIYICGYVLAVLLLHCGVFFLYVQVLYWYSVLVYCLWQLIQVQVWATGSLVPATTWSRKVHLQLTLLCAFLIFHKSLGETLLHPCRLHDLQVRRRKVLHQAQLHLRLSWYRIMFTMIAR